MLQVSPPVKSDYKVVIQSYLFIFSYITILQQMYHTVYEIPTLLNTSVTQQSTCTGFIRTYKTYTIMLGQTIFYTLMDIQRAEELECA